MKQKSSRFVPPALATYFVVDLLADGHHDLRAQTLDERRARLVQVIGRAGAKATIRVTKRLTGAPETLLAAASERGDEGVISKRRDARYPTGRSHDWLKIKCGERDEFAIIGFSPPAGSREHFGALLLATRATPGHALRYAGRVGTGFDDATLRRLLTVMTGIERTTSPCQVPRELTRGVRWVEPVLVADVVFAGNGVTKLDLAQYYEALSELMLPHITGRPLSTLRCPDGPAGTCFFQKHWASANAPRVRVMAVREADGKAAQYAVAKSSADLIRLVQMNVIEFHPWASRAPALEKPDRLILDLDPGPGISWRVLRDSATVVRDALERVGLKSGVKLSGGKGVHITVPLDRRLDWQQFSDFARILASRLTSDNPNTFVDKSAKSSRRNRIFIDWLRNSRGATAAAPWSVRARDNAPVSVPLSWDDIAIVESASWMTVPIAMDYIAQKPSDPWAEMLTTNQRLSARMLALLGGE